MVNWLIGGYFVSMLVMAGGYVGSRKTTDQANRITAISVMVIGLCIGALCVFCVQVKLYQERDAQDKANFVVKARDYFAPKGVKYLEFHKVDTYRAVSFVNSQGQNCGALEHNFGKPICLQDSSKPTWTYKLKTALYNQIVHAHSAVRPRGDAHASSRGRVAL